MRDLTKTGAKINSKIGKAIHNYKLIEDGDKILVAVSGGKDSVTLLYFLRNIQSWAPIKFDLYGIHIRTDLRCGECAHKDSLSKMFESLDMEYKVEDIEVLDENGKTSCFWCSWNRRKTIFKFAEKIGYNKIALGHHKDDIAETILMNLLYKGEVSAMNPRQELFKGKLTIIRPLCYVEEDMVIKFAKESGFSKQLCKCPFGRTSERKYIKEFIRKTEEKLSGVNIRTNIFNAPGRLRKEYMDIKEER